MDLAASVGSRYVAGDDDDEPKRLITVGVAMVRVASAK
jgi:hypothetical protein